MFSSASKYAIRAILFLATNSDEENKWSADEISDQLEVKKPFLSKILQKLAKSNMISSTKGPYGGFYLSEDNKKNKLIDLLECFDDMGSFESCILGLPDCSAKNPCPLHIQAFAFREGLKFQFVHQTINDLALKIKLLDLKL